MHLSEMQQAAYEMVQFAYPHNDLADTAESVCFRLRWSRNGGSLDLTGLAVDLAEVIVCAAQVANTYGIALHTAVEERLIRGGYVPETATRVAGTQSITEAADRAGTGSTAAEQGAGEAQKVTGGSGG